MQCDVATSSNHPRTRRTGRFQGNGQTLWGRKDEVDAGGGAAEVRGRGQCKGGADAEEADLGRGLMRGCRCPRGR